MNQASLFTINGQSSQNKSLSIISFVFHKKTNRSGILDIILLILLNWGYFNFRFIGYIIMISRNIERIFII
jgi:hypothetical protein